MKGNGKTGERAIQEFWYHKRHDGCATIQKSSKHCFWLNGKRSPSTESNMIDSHLNTIRKNKTELLDCNTQSLYINLSNQSMGFMWSPIESTTELLSSREKAQKQGLMKGWICRIRKAHIWPCCTGFTPNVNKGSSKQVTTASQHEHTTTLKLKQPP